MSKVSHPTPAPVIADGMKIEWDVPIEMDDGLVLRADVFRPVEDGQYPVILSYGCYGKGLSFQEGYTSAWDVMVKSFPDVAAGSTNKYQNWEVVDPEKWVPDGYVCVRIDSRGAGRSPGYIDVQSPREVQDVYHCIEWAGVQPWSNGKVGMAGISYYAQNQWFVSGLKPPHLAAMCAWEGAADQYRDAIYHGGILNTMPIHWYDKQAKSVQHGLGERGPRSAVTGELVCGPETLSEEELDANRRELAGTLREHNLDDDYHRSQSAHWDKVETPFLSCGNWGGQGLHPRGNIEAFTQAASKQKWLEMHGFEHWALFYTDYGNDLQKRFFGHFLKGEDTGWDKQPPVQLNIRHPGNKFTLRAEQEWPLARTRWTKAYLDPAKMTLSQEPSGASTALTYEAMGDGLTFRTPPLKEEVEITGPLAAKLFLSSETKDADVFLVVRVFDPEGQEVLFRGALDPKTPVAQGWLRASHRKLDPQKSQPWRPYHAHDEIQPLTPGEPVELDVEIWPTCVVIPAGYTLALTILGRDFEHDQEPAFLNNLKNPLKGCGPFLHNDPVDRPPEVFGQRYTLHFDGDRQPYVLLPVIPTRA